MAGTGSILEREILEQPQILAALLDAERGHIETIARAIREHDPKFILLVARGSSDNAARYGQYIFGTVNRLPVALATPSLYTLYGKTPQLTDALVVAVSQSGQSPDIVSVIEDGRKQGALTIAITNEADSPLANAAEHCIDLHAGREMAVAATKTYTTSLMSLAMLSAALAQDEEQFRQLKSVPGFVDRVTDQTEEIIQRAERYRYMNECVLLSRGYNYATAYEIALKLKELTYVMAEPYSSADFRHGPVALVEEGFPAIAVVPEGVVSRELEELLASLKERGAELIVISALELSLSYAKTPLVLPLGMPEWLSPMVAVVPGQLFALGLTMARGYNPDSPRNIRKVTLTE